MAKPKRPRDTNQLAKLIADISTGESSAPEGDERQRAITEARHKSGTKGAAARAKAMTPEQRSAIASLAANARWKKKD